MAPPETTTLRRLSCSWWKEYAARKNDEDQEHVADSLLYDERCHLPRTTPPPVLSGAHHAAELKPAAVSPQPQAAEQ
jgi:hypothetical protein